MTKNTNSAFSRPTERRRLLHSSRMVYVDVRYSPLGTVDGDNSSDEEELFNLQIIKSKQKPENIIERTLQPGDTLQSISLKYHVPIAELKRLNNMHKENEIHARTSLRIPIKPISSLIDLSPAPVHGDRKTEARTLSIGSGCDPQEFLAAMDRDLAKIRSTVSQQSNMQPTEICFTAIEPTKRETASCSGSDWGLRWQQILLCSIVFTFILPVFVWIKRQQDELETSTLNPM